MQTVIWMTIIIGAGLAGYQFFRSSQTESKEARTIGSLPPSVQHVVAQMDGGSQAAFFNEYDRKKKLKSVGYLAWFFLGWQYLYVGKVGLQFAYWFTFGGFGIWIIADFFRMPGIIRDANEQMARNSLQTLHMGAAFANVPAPPTLMTNSLTNYFVAPAQEIVAANQPQISQAWPSEGRWHGDPAGRHEWRFWDGATWTAHVSNAGVVAHDPL